MTIALYAVMFTLAYLVTTLLLLRAGDRGRAAAAERDHVTDHELAHWRYSWNASRVHQAVPTTDITPAVVDDIRAIAELYICPICENLRMECTCYTSGRIS